MIKHSGRFPYVLEKILENSEMHWNTKLFRNVEYSFETFPNILEYCKIIKCFKNVLAFMNASRIWRSTL